MNARYFFLLALLPLVPAGAWAGTRDDVMAGAARCAGIMDDRSWLDCFYGAAQPMRAQLGLPPAPAAQTARVPPAPGAARSAMAAPPPMSMQASAPAAAPAARQEGLLPRLMGSDAPPIRMTAYHFDNHGLFTVTLANGQVWQQAADDSNFAHWRGPASAYNVNVAEGSYGHASLVVSDGQTYEVRRAN